MSTEHRMECSTLAHLWRVIADAQAAIAQAQAEIDLIEADDREAAMRMATAEKSSVVGEEVAR